MYSRGENRRIERVKLHEIIMSVLGGGMSLKMRAKRYYICKC